MLEAEKLKKKAETDAIIQEMVAKEQAEEEARLARRQAIIDALENIDIEEGLDMELLMAKTVPKR